MDWVCFLPVKIYELSLSRLKEQLASRFDNLTIVLILSAGGMKRTGLDEAVRALKSRNNVIHLDALPPNPTQKTISEALAVIGSKRPDLIISIGGGSAIDVGKSISALHFLWEKGLPLEEDVNDAIKNKYYKERGSMIPIIAVPTTAGSGSEVTKWATVWDFDKNAKYSIEAEWLYPKEAWIVPELTLSMPKRLSLSTGLDALCHATEAYWSKKSNFIVREMSKTAISLITSYLPMVLCQPYNVEYRSMMCYGSLFAGFAFSNTRTTACHSMSYPITMKYGVEHGFAAVLTLYEVLKVNLPVIKDLYLFIRSWGVADLAGIKSWIDNISQEIQPLRLSSFGVKRDEIPEIVKAAFTEGRMDNNPIDLKPEIIYRILSNSF